MVKTEWSFKATRPDGCVFIGHVWASSEDDAIAKAKRRYPGTRIQVMAVTQALDNYLLMTHEALDSGHEARDDD